MTKKTPSESERLEEIRRALADYIASEGCSCCRDTEQHDEAAARLAKLLHIRAYSDGSGYDFAHYRTLRKPRPVRR